MSFTPSSRFDPFTVGVSPKDYQSLGVDGAMARGNPERVMSRSDLREFARCPRKWILGTDRKETGAMRHGTLVDGLLLAPMRFQDRFIIRPDEYQTTGMKCPVCGSVTDSAKCSKCKVAREEVRVTKEWSAQSATCQAWLEVNKDRDIVTVDAVHAARKAVERMNEDEVVGPFVRECQGEVQVCVDYTDRATGLIITLKALLDMVPREDGPFRQSLADLKTTTNASAPAWQRHVHDQGYHYQGAFYLDAYNAATGDERCDFRHVISESSAPYEPAAQVLSEEFLAMGRSEYRADLAFYCRCLAAKDFPGYPMMRRSKVWLAGWGLTEPTPWMMTQAMDAAPEFEMPTETENEPNPTQPDEVIP